MGGVIVFENWLRALLREVSVARMFGDHHMRTNYGVRTCFPDSLFRCLYDEVRKRLDVLIDRLRGGKLVSIVSKLEKKDPIEFTENQF